MDRIKLDWGRREISLDEPISIPGQTYMRISEGIQDPLYVTAMAVDGRQGQDHVIFCSCNIVTLSNDVIPMTCALVAQMRPEINTGAIVMNATHTHSGGNTRANQPTVSPDGKPIYPCDDYRDLFVKMCAEAIVEAWDNRAEGGTYLATERSESNKGYGASLFCNWVGHVGGQQRMEGVLENLNEIKEQLQ